MNVAVVGCGFVGKATEYLLQKTNCTVQIHDPVLGHECDFDTVEYAFICVPTPSTGHALDISILEKVYEDLKDKCQLVIRSTIGPEQVVMFPRAYMMPEFLRERCWKQDVDDPKLPLIIGMEETDDELIEIFEAVNKTVYTCQPKEASMFKLMRNAALAMRVAVANEFYEICQRENVDYKFVSGMLSTDNWTGGTHWDVPGPDGMMGFGGSCFPKDLTHMKSLCYNDFNIFNTALAINKVRRNK
jgi:UDP-glucose 6-dehydrogenase